MRLVRVAAQKTGQRVKCQWSVNCGESLMITTPRLNHWMVRNQIVLFSHHFNQRPERRNWADHSANSIFLGTLKVIITSARLNLWSLGRFFSVPSDIGKSRHLPVFPVALSSTHWAFHCFNWLRAVTNLAMFSMSLIHVSDSSIWLLRISLWTGKPLCFLNAACDLFSRHPLRPSYIPDVQTDCSCDISCPLQSISLSPSPHHKRHT